VGPGRSVVCVAPSEGHPLPFRKPPYHWPADLAS
jgi:hypothetical protein